MRNPSTVAYNRRGQAMVEFIVGIIVVIVAVGAFIQIGLLANSRSETYMDATQEAALLSMSVEDPDHIPITYIQATFEGDDDATYSEDDQRTLGDGEVIIDDILSHTMPDQLGLYVDDSPFTDIQSGGDLTGEFGLVRGDARDFGIRLLPVVRRLIYRADRIDMDEEVYSIWTRGIY